MYNHNSLISGPTLLDHIHEKIQPYTLKNDKATMSSVREFTITSSPSKVSQCGVIHHSPAVIFSACGYNGNFFHEISDIFIPLYITVNSLSPTCDGGWYAMVVPKIC